MAVKVVAINRKAKHNYFLEDKYEAGMVLTGTEIKAIREGKVQFMDAYISFVNHEAFIKEMHISQYSHGNIFNHDETRIRKLLLNRSEINKLEQKCKLSGNTVIPYRIYLRDGMAKLEIFLAKGKDLYDKRQSDKERTMKRDIQKALKNNF